MVAYGHRLPFLAYPLRCFVNSNRFAMKQPDIVNESILELLHNDCTDSLIRYGMEEAPLGHTQMICQGILI